MSELDEDEDELVSFLAGAAFLWTRAALAAGFFLLSASESDELDEDELEDDDPLSFLAGAAAVAGVSLFWTRAFFPFLSSSELDEDELESYLAGVP